MVTPEASPDPVKVLFCGDRPVAAQIVAALAHGGNRIVGLGLNPTMVEAAAKSMVRAARVDRAAVFYGKDLASDVALRSLARAAPDLGICCGFSSVLPARLLAIPRWGWVNFHRSYLPYNRGLDPLQWALIEETPAGVSLHVMTEHVDAGPIVAQTVIPVRPDDDIGMLKDRADVELYELFRAAWPRLARGDLAGTPQDEDLATYHSQKDCDRVRRLELKDSLPARRLLNILRAYSSEALPAYFEVTPGGTRFAVRIRIGMVGG